MSTVLEDPAAKVLGETPAPAETPASPESSQSTKRPTPLLTSGPRIPTRSEILRPAFGALSTTIGCAFLVGGMFVGITPRIYAAVGGIAGVGMAVWAARAQRRVTLIQILSLFGVLFAGLILLGISGFGNISHLGTVISEAGKNARLHRPPAPFDTGWRAILPWTVGLIGYAAAWVGSVGGKPAMGVLIPIPVIAFAAIAQPSEAQIPAGIVAFVTFVIGLAVIYRADRGEGEGVSTAYELKRALKTAPLILVLAAALIGLSQTGFLFPKPIFDPTEKPQKPHPIPLSQVVDRVLFTVTPTEFTGPWRTGVLDFYDSVDWRSPPFGRGNFDPVPDGGRIDAAFGQEQLPQRRVTVTINHLDGVVIPLPNRVQGIVVTGPKLVIDTRGQSLRLDEGSLDPKKNLKYELVFADLPACAPPPGECVLKTWNATNPQEIVQQFTDTANQPPPPAVKALLDKAPKQLWDRLEFVRNYFISGPSGSGRDGFVSKGPGLPSNIPPSRVDELLTTKKEGTPYEFVAAQVLLARWAGIPARIGYGFDKGNKLGATLEYRPIHGASWLEVYFQGYGWFPITGSPKTAKASLGNDPKQQAGDILPSDDIAVNLFLPLRTSQSGLIFKQAQAILFLISPFAITILLIWLLWPIAYKARRRTKRREWALTHGPGARIAVMYAELRDMATDLGVGDPYVTPLAYVTKVVPDEEHRELAWLVTRCLWGDLREHIKSDDVLAAGELSRSLRRRLFEAQPFTIRAISLVSRISLRNPYAPELLSPPLGHFSLKSLVRIGKRKTRKTKEIRNEAMETA